MSLVKAATAGASWVEVIDAKTPDLAKLRVAAYARVSSDSADQANSYIAQINHYNKIIRENDNWELIDVYADQGLTGTDVKNRDDFNRMIQDCRDGKIDRILVKSISRFARNTQDYIRYMRELLRLGISIHFEKENIDTGKMKNEQIAIIYGAFAQMESTNHSENMRFSIRMRMKAGEYTPPSAPYGYRLENRELEIIPEEAEIVRYIFNSYLQGKGKDYIARELNSLAIFKNQRIWHPNTILYVLTNVTYIGDMLWQKYYSTNSIPFRKAKNKGQKPQYYVEETHSPIISKEDFEQVQILLQKHREQFQSGVLFSSIYKKHVRCGNCGSTFRRKVIRERAYWICYKRDLHGAASCSLPQILESSLEAAVLRVYNKLKSNPQIISDLIDQLQEIQDIELRANRRIADIDNEIAKLAEQLLVLLRLHSKGFIDSALYLTQKNEEKAKLENLRKLRRKIIDSSSEDKALKESKKILHWLEQGPEWMVTPDQSLFGNLIDQIIVISPEEIKVRLHNNLELSEFIERTKR